MVLMSFGSRFTLIHDPQTDSYWWSEWDGRSHGPYASLTLCLSDASQLPPPEPIPTRPAREPKCPQCRSSDVIWNYGDGVSEGECQNCNHVWGY